MIKLDSVSEQTEQGLKPCPFCGGEAVLINTRAFGESCKSVMCIKCRATVSNFAGDMQEERATEAWNRRADNEV